MTRQNAIANAQSVFDTGRFIDELSDLVSIQSESNVPSSADQLEGYLRTAMLPIFADLGATARIVPNPDGEHGPFLIAERFEAEGLTTVLLYGHGDVVNGTPEKWMDGVSPWEITRIGDRIYGRGTADNKGQHLVNLVALREVLAIRGRLGFNLRVVIEMGEEAGSPGLHDLCIAERGALEADVLIASDGPRLSAVRPTVYMGARGCLSFQLQVELRDGANHSGNWGGVLRDPAVVLSEAILSIVDRDGVIKIPEWRPDTLSPDIRAALADCEFERLPGDPKIDADWGEPKLSAVEKVIGWNSFAVLAIAHGDPVNPVGAIRGSAHAECQLRFVVGTDPDDIVPALRRHLAAHGLSDVTVKDVPGSRFNATRLAPDDPWAEFARRSIKKTTGSAPAMLPNLGGSLPNEEFASLLGMPTIWVPHSYPGCAQHAPNEHALGSILREGLGIMAGLWWDIGAEAEQ